MNPDIEDIKYPLKFLKSLDSKTLQSLESKFLQDLREHSRGIVSIGAPNTGKTFMMLCFVKWALNNNIYEEYHMVLPNFEYEENGSYNFLKDFKSQVFVYNELHEVVTSKVLKLRDKKRVFFGIDDATSSLAEKFDPNLIKLYAESRHGKKGGITTWVVSHGTKKILAKTIRGCVKYVFIYDLESGDILEDLYDCFLSLRYIRTERKLKDFMQEYFNKVSDVPYGCIMVARQIGVDYDVVNWQVLKETIEKKEKTKEIKKEISKPRTQGFKINFSKFNI